jgi:hypothetical protein
MRAERKAATLFFLILKIRYSFQHKSPYVLKTIEQGAATSVWCNTSAALDGMGSAYCEDCDITEAVPVESKKGSGVRAWATYPEDAIKLWQLSEKFSGVKLEF